MQHHDNQVNASFRLNPAVCGGGLNGADCSVLLTKHMTWSHGKTAVLATNANRGSQIPQLLVNVANVANTLALSACDGGFGLCDLVAGFLHENTEAAHILMIHLLRAGDPAAMINVSRQFVALTRRATAGQSSCYPLGRAGIAVM